MKMAGIQSGTRRISITASSKVRQVSNASRNKWLGAIARDRHTRARAADHPIALPQPGNGKGG
jgi:hypothetical protein